MDQVEQSINVVKFEQTFQDFPHPSKIALIVFVAGCDNQCIGCHAEDLKNPNYGDKITLSRFEEVIDYYNNYYKTCNNLVFEGGDILFNEKTINFLKTFLERNTKYNVCVYTGKRNFEVINIMKDWKVRPNIIKFGGYNYKQSRTSFKDDNKFVLASPNQGFMKGKDFKIISSDGVLYFNDTFIKKIKRFFNKEI